MIKPKNLNQALGLLLIFVTVPLLLGALALLVSQTRSDQQLAQTQLTALAQTLAQAVDREFDRGKAQLDVMADSSVMDRRDWSELHAFGSSITRNSPGSRIVLVGPDGQILLSTAVPLGKPLPNLWSLSQQPDVLWEGRKLPPGSQNMTRQVFETNQAAYSNLYYGVFSKQPVLALSVPVVRDGRVAYALVLSFPPERIDRLIRASVNAPGLRALVIDRRSVVVAGNAASAHTMGDTIDPLPIPAGSLAGTFERTSRDGTRIHGAYATSAVNGFTVRVALPTADMQSTWVGLGVGWLLLAVGVLLGSIFFVAGLGRRIAMPLRQLGNAARNGRVPDAQPTGIAEIDLLARALRTGAQAEEKRREELIISVQRQQAELDLRRADRQKDEFLATLAHELRNPLAPIRTAVELIRQRQPTDAVVLRARDVIERQVSHLALLVDDLLEVSRINTGTIQLRLELLDLCAVVASVAESAGPTLRAAGRTLVPDLGSALDRVPVMVNGDETRLSQCVLNLLNNAVKFTQPGGCITVRVLTQGHQAVVEVSDNGIGIAADNLDRIFELFVQANPSGSDGHTGLGIGLALTRKLVVLHGGTVNATSAGTGHGSCFRIELPLLASPAAMAMTPTPTPTTKTTTTSTTTTTHDTLEQAPIEPAASGARVLVVDDNCDAADMLCQLLTFKGFDATAQYTGEGALRAIESRPPDAVLLDIGLPDMIGYQVCRRIRAMAGLEQPVVIALTGWGQASDRKRAQAAGFDGHLTKPTKPDTVIALLNEKIAARSAALSARDSLAVTD